MEEKAHIVVIGAGVIGLSCALQLSQQGYHVTVLARELPGDWDINYASPRAGAHFRPTPVITNQDAIENGYMRASYAEFQRVAREEESAGVAFVPAIEYFDSELSQRDMEMFAGWPEFRMLSPDELPHNVKAGVTYSAWVLNSPVYLEWLRTRAEAQGVCFSRTSLVAVPEAYFIASELRQHLPDPSVVINASGMGFGDAASFPSRGQFILISNDYDRTISHHSSDGYATVIIPRPLGGGCVIGGTKEPHNWSPNNSPEAIREVLDRVSNLCPDLLKPLPNVPDSTLELHVKEAYIGRRPMRNGGLRLEEEEIDVMKLAINGIQNIKGTLKVVHCYGAGPSGFKIGWGAAAIVCQKVQQLLLS